MAPRTPAPPSLPLVIVLGAAMFGCGPTPRAQPPAATGAAATGAAALVPPERAALAPAPAGAPEPEVVRVGAGESVVVAPGQIVEGGWFRVAVFGDQSCGPSLGGGTLHGIDFYYDNITPLDARFFTKSATVELTNARGEAFEVVGGHTPGGGCGPGLLLGEGAKPGARLRGWPFAGLPAGAERPTRVRLVLEEPHGFAVSTVTIELGLPGKPPAPLPARSEETGLSSNGAGAATASSPYLQLASEGLRSCTSSDDPWLERVFAEAKAAGQTMRIVGVDLRLENRSNESLDLTPMEVVDADGRGYSVYPPSRTSCELGRFPDEVASRATGRGTVGFALVPSGTRGLSVRVEIRPVGRSPYDGYKPFTALLPLGDVGR